MAIGGPGLGLPYPTNPYPAPTVGGPTSFVWSNFLYMPASTVFMVPPGTWYIKASVAEVQWRDPVSGLWLPPGTNSALATVPNGMFTSDGSNLRIANMTGTPVSANVTTPGTTYVQATTTVVAATGLSTWRAIVGGSVGTVTVGADAKGNTGGTNFTLVPLIIVSAPPPGGVQATATCTISGGAITSVSPVAAGAGYTSPPSFLVIPNPNDVNIGKITVPALTAPLAGAGTVTAVLVVNPGAAAAAPTLTISGGDGTAAATAVDGPAGAVDTVYLQLVGGVG